MQFQIVNILNVATSLCKINAHFIKDHNCDILHINILQSYTEKLMLDLFFAPNPNGIMVTYLNRPTA